MTIQKGESGTRQAEIKRMPVTYAGYGFLFGIIALPLAEWAGIPGVQFSSSDRAHNFLLFEWASGHVLHVYRLNIGIVAAPTFLGYLVGRERLRRLAQSRQVPE